MSKREERVIELAVNMIRLGDEEQISDTLTAAILATAFVMGITPRDVAETLFMGSPLDEDWRDNIVEKLQEDVDA